MTDKFDPATHRFGYAYRFRIAGTDPIFVLRNDNERRVFAFVDGRIAAIDSAHLIRASEHDLIPCAEAVPQDVLRKVAEALELSKEFWVTGRAPAKIDEALALLAPFVTEVG